MKKSDNDILYMQQYAATNVHSHPTQVAHLAYRVKQASRSVSLVRESSPAAVRRLIPSCMGIVIGMQWGQSQCVGSGWGQKRTPSTVNSVSSVASQRVAANEDDVCIESNHRNAIVKVHENLTCVLLE
jgi:hypothetical protein